MIKKLTLLTISLFALAAGTLALTSRPTEAAEAANFKAGRIIDDAIFFNKDSMSVTDIQNFLNSKVPTCDTNHAWTGSEQPPWRCLKDYYENPTTKENNLDGRPVPAGGISAAQIIYDAAQTYSINPQALIVLLQKEQSLITDTWPFDAQYRTATGYGCPDGAPCDAQYYGFYNQVTKAAFQFRRYATYPAEYNYRAGINNNILYHPSAACGTKSVFIENQATAGLYNYTPYTPNQAALNNLYGTGDGCSSYGNRNFWRLFTDWFGDPLGPMYGWQLVGQKAYTDSSLTTQIDITSLLPGQVATLVVEAKNIGNQAWLNTGPNAVKLGTSSPQDRASQFANGWIGTNRPASFSHKLSGSSWVVADTVASGETTRFVFNITMPQVAGEWREYFTPLVEGITWMNNPGMNFYIKSPDWRWQFISQSSDIDLSSMKKGQIANVTITAKNMGTRTWRKAGADQVRLGTTAPQDRSSIFVSDGWVGANRASSLDGDVQPNSTAVFRFKMTAPYSSLGSYSERFNLVAEGIAWLNDPGASFAVNIVDGTNSAGNAPQAYTAAWPDSTSDSVTLRFVNNGTTFWHRGGSNPTQLGTSSSGVDRNSVYSAPGWISGSRATNLNEDSVGPGQTGSFTFKVRMPSSPGITSETFNVVIEGVSWLAGTGVVSITTHGSYAWEFRGQGASTDLSRLSPGQEATLTLDAKNTGTAVWGTDNATPINLGASSPRDRSSVFNNGWLGTSRAGTFSQKWNGSSWESASRINPSETARFTWNIKAPATGGVFREYFSLVAEGLTWLNDPGANFYTQVHQDYRWQLIGQAAQVSASDATAVDLTNLSPNQTVYLKVTAKNLGASTWYKTGGYQVHLGTSNPQDRSSPFCATGWLGCNRSAEMSDAVVSTNGQTTFGFYYKAPATKGTYREYFNPVAEGITWMNDPGMNFYTVVK